MADTMQPHWKHAGGKCWQHGWDKGTVVMKDCCFEPIMSDLMHKGKSFVHGTNDWKDVPFLEMQCPTTLGRYRFFGPLRISPRMFS
jgi:hypothetical protein